MKNTEERVVINSLIAIKEYCSKNDSAGKCFCCLMYGLCNKCFKGLPSLWDIKNPYEDKE